MRNLTEKEIKMELPDNGTGCGTVAFKQLKCLKSYRFSREITVNGKPFPGFKSGKSYGLWCVGINNNSKVLVFIPGVDQEGGFVFGTDTFRDWETAPDAYDASYRGNTFTMIVDCHGERLLVPFKTMCPGEVHPKPASVGYNYWRAEFVCDGTEWFFGAAFYGRDFNGIFSPKKQNWKAFFRVDTQSWLPQDYEAQRPALVKVALSVSPVEVGNFRIQFVQDIIKFSFI